VFVAKYVADQVTHSLYIALLEVKCVPFLEPEPPLPMMDCFTASQVMSKPVVCLPVIPRVSEVIEVLKSEFHHAFPVVSDCTIVNKIGDRSEEMSKKVFRGVITRDQLEMLLSHKKLFRVHPIPEVHPVLSFEEAQEWEEHRHMSRRERDDLLKVDYRVTDEERDKFLPLEQYMNESALSVGVNCSLKHTYILFRSMALRHLVVVNQYNEVCGVITRKDLLACNMASRIGTSMGITKESQP
jgi:chloride channel 7